MFLHKEELLGMRTTDGVVAFIKEVTQVGEQG